MQDGGLQKNHSPLPDLPAQSKREWYARVQAKPLLNFNMETTKCFQDANGNLNPPVGSSHNPNPQTYITLNIVSWHYIPIIAALPYTPYY